MAKKVEIASLTIDVNDVIKQSAKLKTQIDGLKKEQKELTKLGEESSEQYVTNALAVNELSKSYKDNQKLAQTLIVTDKELNKTMSTQSKSTQQLRDDRAKLNVLSKNIKGNTEKEIAQRKKLNTAIDAQTQKIKEQSPAYIQQKENIGNYSGALGVLSPQLSGIAMKLGTVTTALQAKKAALLGSTAATNGASKGLKLFRIALISTGIGAIVIALGALVAAFASTQSGSDAITKALAPLKEMLATIWGVMQDLATAMAALDWSGMKESVSGLEDKLEEAAKRGRDMAQAIINLEQFNIGLTIATAKLNRQFEDQVNLSKDMTKSDKERLKAASDANVTYNTLISLQQSELEQRIEIAFQKTEANNTDRKAKQELADLEAALINLDAQSSRKKRTNLVLISSLEKRFLKEKADAQKEYAAQQIEEDKFYENLFLESKKKEVGATIAAAKEELQLYIENQDGKLKTLEEALIVEQVISDKKIEILKNELSENLISQTEFNTESLNIHNELLLKQTELTVENSKIELANYIESNKSKLDAERFLSEELYNKEQTRLDTIAEKKKEYEAKRLEEGLITETEYNELINEINDENYLLLDELDLARQEARLEQEAINFENKLALQESQNMTQYDIQTKQLQREYQAEIESAKKTGADVTIINKKYAAQQKQIDDIKNKAQLDSAEALFGNLATLLGEHTDAGKAAGIAAATINTYQGVTEVWKAPSVLPEPLNTIIKVAATAVTIAAGVASVRKITAVNTKLAKGDILQGASHANGGVDLGNGYEAEGGEAVINKKSTSMFAPILSAINVAGGGKKFATGGIVGASSVPSSVLDVDVLSEKIGEANALLPNPVVSVQQITTVTNDVAVIESDTDF